MSTDLWNVGKLTPACTGLQPRRQPSSKLWHFHESSPFRRKSSVTVAEFYGRNAFCDNDGSIPATNKMSYSYSGPQYLVRMDWVVTERLRVRVEFAASPLCVHFMHFVQIVHTCQKKKKRKNKCLMETTQCNASRSEHSDYSGSWSFVFVRFTSRSIALGSRLINICTYTEVILDFILCFGYDRESREILQWAFVNCLEW
jgi:hypothetical protein